MVSKNVVETVDTVYCRKSEQTEESAMKSLFEEMGGTYRREGDYLLPNLTVPESVSVGIWGQRRKQYLREHRKSLYTALLPSGELDPHLADIDRQSEDMFSQLIAQMAQREGITEQLKAENQMEWVGRMNNIRSVATDIVNKEIIHS
jgi:hypothetical protein